MMDRINKSNKSVWKNRKKSLASVICLVFMGLSLSVLPCLINASGAETTAENPQEKETPDFQNLIGKWVRIDGGFVIEVSKIHADGKVDAAYFNPRSINVGEASVTDAGGELELFIKLQDQGYPGSTYKLKYNTKYDAMVGVYFQAVMRQSFEVIFQRKK
jgi:hypothetical protein